MTDRWAEWKEVQIQVPLTVGIQMPGEAGTAEEGKQVQSCRGQTEPPGVCSVIHQEGQKEPFSCILSGGARGPGVVLSSRALPRLPMPSVWGPPVDTAFPKRAQIQWPPEGQEATCLPPGFPHRFSVELLPSVSESPF